MIPFRLGAVFALSFLWFSIGAERRFLTSDYVDPVSRIPAQDEAVYGHEAIQMSLTGQWVTPVFLGRYALNKPPLFQWLAAAGVRIFGISSWSLRLPSLLAASGITVVVFWTMWRMHSLLAGTVAALLLTSSHLFYVFARLAMTDMLLTLWIVVALALILRDPRLERVSSVVIFAAATGAAVLTKAAAGLIPVIALAIHTLAAPRVLRPSLRRSLAACALAAAVALPWHLYQLAVHPRWFVAEYILTQHFAVGLAAPPQYSSENHLLFYTRRLWLMDPVLCVAALLALPLLARTWRKRPAVAIWPGAIILVLFAFRYRSAYYLLPLVPLLAMLAVETLAVVPLRLGAALAAGVLAISAIKTPYPAQTWGIQAAVMPPRPILPALENYCAKHRANELIVIAGEDQFYAADLPLPRVRYCLLEKPQPAARRPPLDFASLGITVTVPEFNHLDTLLPVWRQRLGDFGLLSDAPIATVITAGSPPEIRDLIASHPESDFWIPASLLRRLNLTLAHGLEPADGDGVFLLAPQRGFFQAKRACHL